MSIKIKVELGAVEKTLFMPVWARAVETKKDKPVLLDNTAVEIMDSVDFDFSHMSENIAEISQIAWIARCKRFDRVIKEFILLHPEGTIVNIGCGLDTTWERLNSGSILWYDLDLPDVIDVKKRFVAGAGNRRFIASSFLDTEWFEDILVTDRVLFISTGVFVYFEENVIRDFIIKVGDRFDNSEFFFDVTSPKGVEIANQVIERSGLDSRSFFKWGLTDKSIISSWDKRIKLLDTYYTFKIDGLDLSPDNRRIAEISDSLDIQYMIHLRISENELSP